MHRDRDRPSLHLPFAGLAPIIFVASPVLPNTDWITIAMADEVVDDIVDDDQADGYRITPGAVQVTKKTGIHKRSWFFAAGDVRVIDDIVFLHMATRNSTIKSLFSHMFEDADQKKNNLPAHVLAKTDVIDQLIRTKNKAIRDLIVAGQDHGIQDKRCRSKKARENKLMLPAYIDITTPSIEGVDSITMKVMTAAVGKNASFQLWMELNSTTVDFVTTAVARQMASGRPVQKNKKLKTQNSTEGSPCNSVGEAVCIDNQPDSLPDGDDQSQVVSPCNIDKSEAATDAASDGDDALTSPGKSSDHDIDREPAESNSSSSQSSSSRVVGERKESVLDMLLKPQHAAISTD